MPDDLQSELLKRSWAIPANRPPRDTWRPPKNTLEDELNAPFHQRQAVEDTVGVLQPSWNIGLDGGLLQASDGSRSVVTDPLAVIDSPSSPEHMEQMAILRYVLQNPKQFPRGQADIQDVLDAADEDSDAEDNADQDPEEMIARLRTRMTLNDDRR